MAFGDKLKDLRSKAGEAVVERKDQIEQAVQKAGAVADQRTGGKYHDKIEHVGGRAVGLVDSLGESAKSAEPTAPEAAETPSAEPAAPEAVETPSAEQPPGATA